MEIYGIIIIVCVLVLGGFGVYANLYKIKKDQFSEIGVCTFPVAEILSLKMIEFICRQGYKETGRKFSVNFNGSKGYLDHIEIWCESQKGYKNRIDKFDLVNPNGKFVTVHFSKENGVRLSIS